ncbi:hypothetical protein FIA58_011595 [Flavobacterium jejuense]|uniref:Uncharacterized protein n=1 Tax=Flavobacterium jejuense TaxID=1544455 RepID=A0ABX0IUW1_9FLAO|nr:hypothetical protein [Flavobacterium jejuense]NHN26323.1 hypothetical protein [Flavobacterium jejuense]
MFRNMSVGSIISSNFVGFSVKTFSLLSRKSPSKAMHGSEMYSNSHIAIHFFFGITRINN